MMNIVGLDIEINRGNAAGLTFHFEGDDVPADGTAVVFQVRPDSKSNHTVMEKESTVQDGAVDFSFEPDDTVNMEPGVYYWNACIQYANGLEPWTVMRDWAMFRLYPGAI